MGKEEMRWVETVTREQWEMIDEVISRYRGRHGGLIPVLKEVQDICGYLPRRVQHRIAEGLNLSPSQVYGVVSFYAFFTTLPRGRHVIRVCMGTACYVRGAREILDNLQRQLGVEVGGMTKDRKFSLEAVRCLGACGLAPVVAIGQETFGMLDPKKAVEVLRNYP
ncbi:MAG: NADH-quinone oxidoreductase subunit NuoE family protein [Thermodesulfobacteriota bacterium]